MVDEQFASDNKFVMQLNGYLDKAAYLFSVRKGEDGSDDAGRFGTRLALHAAIELLNDCGATSSQIKPLNRLSKALDMLDHGKVTDLLSPVKRSGRPPNDPERDLLKALSVAAVDLYMASGFSENESCAKVARRLLTHGYTVTNDPEATAKSVVKGWRKNVDVNPARERRDNILIELETVVGSNDAKAEKILEQLPGIVSVKS